MANAKKRKKVPVIYVRVSREEHDEMSAAAARSKWSVSVWARLALRNALRSGSFARKASQGVSRGG